jgi:hypothetical protein
LCSSQDYSLKEWRYRVEHFMKVTVQINGWEKGNRDGVLDLNYMCIFLASELISILYTGEDKKFSPRVNLSVLPRPQCLKTDSSWEISI